MKKATKKKSLIFTVTNDLIYDQRMIRICSSLESNGYSVELIGRRMKSSPPLDRKLFRQKRLSCFSEKGFTFYAEYNIRLFFYLLFRKADLYCAIDLDTILPVYFISLIRRSKRAYDAHELFCEMKEIATRPAIYKFWKSIEKFAVPRFKHGYTVNKIIAEEFKKMYAVTYGVIRNMPLLENRQKAETPTRFALYQGAVNEGRSFETLIPAFKAIDLPLIICGDGNFMKQARELVHTHGLQEKVTFTGKLSPPELKIYTSNAFIGFTLFDRAGLSNYYSLANRFFDYMHSGVPQICVDFPVYRKIVDEHPFAILIDDLSAENIAKETNRLIRDTLLYHQLQQACMKARNILNWQEEEKILLHFYRALLPE